MNRGGRIELIEPGQNYEGLVSTIARILPALTDGRVEKVCHEPISVKGRIERGFQETGSVKFCEALQFIRGESVQKIEY